MRTGIYMIRNKINDKKYIGQAVDIDVRWGQHVRELNDNRHYNRYLQRAWNKYGEDNFEFTIIHECDEELLDELEIMYIAHYHTFYKDGNGGYNLTFGGDGARGYRYTDEQRARSSEAKKEYYKDPENRKKHSEALNRPEVKKKHRERTKEAVNRPEVKKKHSEALNRPEVKKKRSEALKEYYKDPENRKKASKKVYCVTNDTVYASTVEAVEKLNIPGGAGTVSWCCKGKYRWGNGHIYKKLGLEFWFLSEYEEKFGKVAM